MGKYCRARRAADDREDAWSFLRQQWIRERVSVLRCTYIASLVCLLLKDAYTLSMVTDSFIHS